VDKAAFGQLKQEAAVRGWTTNFTPRAHTGPTAAPGPALSELLTVFPNPVRARRFLNLIFYLKRPSPYPYFQQRWGKSLPKQCNHKPAVSQCTLGARAITGGLYSIRFIVRKASKAGRLYVKNGSLNWWHKLVPGTKIRHKIKDFLKLFSPKPF